MRESQFGFQYDWADLKPIRPLMWAVVAAQLIGSVLGYRELVEGDAFDKIWTGGALASFPGYVVGCALQFLIRRQRFAEHGRMIWHTGLLAALLSPAAWLKYLIP